MLLLILLILLLCGGFGGWGYRSGWYGNRAAGPTVGGGNPLWIILFVLLILALLGGGFGYYRVVSGSH
jgi:hypothetical protein